MHIRRHLYSHILVHHEPQRHFATYVTRWYATQTTDGPQMNALGFALSWGAQDLIPRCPELLSELEECIF